MIPDYDLRLMARRAMLESGFQPDIPPEAVHEALTAKDRLLPEVEDTSVQDLRGLLWSSLDNAGSLDLDQVEFVEKGPQGDLRLRVGIADVDELARRASACDLHAFTNTTSVYTPLRIFPMLPEELSTGATSLLDGEDRMAVVIEMHIDADGEVTSRQVYQANLRNHARLDYGPVGAWLQGSASVPAKVASLPGLEEQIRLQEETAQRLAGLRHRLGALQFETVQAEPVAEDGKIVAIEAEAYNPAQEIVESFMIAANVAMAEYLEKAGSLSLRRVVRTPKRWDRIVEIAAGLGEKLPGAPDPLALSEFMGRRRQADPQHFPDLSLTVIKLLGPGEYSVDRQGLEHEGHFGLAVHDYTHSTAPNRRYADLVTQRLVKAVLADNPPPYTEADLTEVAAHCTERENAAKKVERRMNKAAAALLLLPQVGEQFDALVTGAASKGTWVRLFHPPVEGRLMRGESGLDVGDRVRVRLLSADPEQGFIDFERVK